MTATNPIVSCSLRWPSQALVKVQQKALVSPLTSYLWSILMQMTSTVILITGISVCIMQGSIIRFRVRLRKQVNRASTCSTLIASTHLTKGGNYMYSPDVEDETSG